MIKASRLAIAIAVVGPLVVAMAGESLAGPVPSNTMAITSAVPAVATDVGYWAYVDRPYFDYDYAYRPAYKYQGYTYWYPTYSYPWYYNW